MANKKRTIAACFSSQKERELVTALLSGLGYDVADFDAENGTLPDLYILDAPSAVRIGRQVLALKQTTDVFLPAMVALRTHEPIGSWLADGFDDCLREPFSKTELQTKVAMLLRLRKQSEELARRSEATYHAIFEATGTATLLVDEDTTIIMANETNLVVTGYSPEEIIGTKWTKYVSPESLETMLKYHKARRGDSEKAPERYETKLINKAGDVREAILDIGLLPGTKKSVVSLLDITEHKRAEQHYRALFEGAPAMYVLTHNEGGVPIIAECNELFLSTLGYTRTEAVGRPLADLYTPESRRALLDGGYHRAMNGRFTSEERQLVARDGRIVETLLRTLPEIDAQGKVIGTLAMFVDLTDMRAAQDAMKASEARYRALFENMHTVMLVIDPENGDVVDANPAAEHFYGWSREALMRKKRGGPAKSDRV
ncbi:MAG TPA: PAS domain S-box protein [Dissulfurispiraceae bacterium]|nr:PAS domain S-box protein [Dissulfurispiraceae bacterium]